MLSTVAVATENEFTTRLAATLATECYRIYTEDKPGLPNLVSGFFQSFTFYRGVGFWKGNCEQSAYIEILGTPYDAADIRILAKLIKETFSQETVYVSRSA